MTFLWNKTTELKARVGTTITEVKDGTKDTAVVLLDKEYGVKVGDLVQIDPGDGRYYPYIVNVVERILLSTAEDKYYEKLSLVQYVDKLSRYLVRNSSFTQANNNQRYKASAYTSYYYIGGTEETGNYCHLNEIEEAEEGMSSEWDTPYYLNAGEEIISVDISKQNITFYADYPHLTSIEADGDSDVLQEITLVIKNSASGGSLSFTVDPASPSLTNDKKDQIIALANANKDEARNITISISGRAVAESVSPNPVSVSATEVTGPYIFCVGISLEFEARRYTMYDVLDELNSQYAMYSDLDNGATWEKPFILPPSSTLLYKILTETTAPNLSFTNNTLYEAVSNVFAWLDLYPDLSVSPDGDVLTFRDPSLSEVREDALQLSSNSYSIGVERHVNRLVLDYQNAFMSQLQEVSMPRATSLGIPGQTDWAFITTQGIQSVKRLEVDIVPFVHAMHLQNFHDCEWSSTKADKTPCYVDISDFIYEQTAYDALSNVEPSYSDDMQISIQTNSLAFDLNGNSIKLAKYADDSRSQIYYFIDNVILRAIGRILGITKYDDARAISTKNNAGINIASIAGGWENQSYRISYTATKDGRGVVSSTSYKEEGEALSSQTNGNPSLERLGTQAQYLSAKTGEEARIVTFKVRKGNGSMPRLGQMVEDKWAISSITSQVVSDEETLCVCNLTKNYSQLMMNANVRAQARQYQISNDLAVSSRGVMGEYCYITMSKAGASAITKKNGDRLSAFSYGSATPRQTATLAVINSVFANVSWPFRVMAYQSVSNYDGNNIFLPSVQYAFGKSYIMEGGFKSPLSADVYAIEKGQVSWWFDTATYKASAVKYAGDNGIDDKMNILFLLDYAHTTESARLDFPRLTLAVAYGGIPNLNFYKRNNEAFNLTYFLSFLPYEEGEFIGNGVAKQISLEGRIHRKKVVFSSKKATELGFAKGYDLDEKCLLVSSTPSYDSSLGCAYVNIMATGTLPDTYEAWGIYDEDTQELIYYRNGSVPTAWTPLYFVLTRRRL